MLLPLLSSQSEHECYNAGRVNLRKAGQLGIASRVGGSLKTEDETLVGCLFNCRSLLPSTLLGLYGVFLNMRQTNVQADVPANG